MPNNSSYASFAEASLKKARISFDTFIDGQSELDVISESAELRDSRVEKSLYNVILRSLESNQEP